MSPCDLKSDSNCDEIGTPGNSHGQNWTVSWTAVSSSFWREM